MYNWETYIKKFKQAEIIDDREKYKFGLAYSYLTRMAFFYLALTALVGISLMDALTNHYKIKMLISILLAAYFLISLFRIFLYRIIIDEKKLKYGKHNISLENVKTVTLTIGRISVSKVGRCLKIITNDKKEYILNLNIHDSIKFLKILENRIGEKFLINEGA